MTYQNGKPIQREIAALAASQGGYFTAKQADALGYERRRLTENERDIGDRSDHPTTCPGFRPPGRGAHL